jgi:hypothetical protein
MEFGIFNPMGSRGPAKPTAEVFTEVAEQTRLADEARLYDRLVRRASFLELLPLCVAADDGRALRPDHQEDPARHRGSGVAALQSGGRASPPRSPPPTPCRTDA